MAAVEVDEVNQVCFVFYERTSYLKFPAHFSPGDNDVPFAGCCARLDDLSIPRGLQYLRYERSPGRGLSRPHHYSMVPGCVRICHWRSLWSHRRRHFGQQTGSEGSVVAVELDLLSRRVSHGLRLECLLVNSRALFGGFCVRTVLRGGAGVSGRNSPTYLARHAGHVYSVCFGDWHLS